MEPCSAPEAARVPAWSRTVDTLSVKACIDSLQKAITNVEALAAEMALLADHRVDFERERERDRAEHLMAELLKATADTMAAKETAARLEGELTALRSRPWWRRIAG